MKKKEDERGLTSSTSGEKHSGDGVVAVASPLLVIAEPTPLWLDVVSPVRRGRGMVGRSTPLSYYMAALSLRGSVPAGGGVGAAASTFFARGSRVARERKEKHRFIWSLHRLVLESDHRQRLSEFSKPAYRVRSYWAC
jgi:hypothetical protein